MLATFARSTTAKLFLLGVLALMLLLPLGLIHRLVQERANTAQLAQQRIAASWGREQQLLLPMLRFDYGRERLDAKQRPVREQQVRLLSPAAAQIQAQLLTQTRSLGIYSLPIYSVELKVEGRFNPAEVLDPPDPQEGWVLERSSLQFAPGDLTGLREIRQLVLGRQSLALKPSSERWNLGMSHADHGRGRPVLSASRDPAWEDWATAAALPFVIELEMAGARSLQLVPNAADLALSISGDWPHPGFANGALPRQREVSASGFSAQWRLLDLSTGIPAVLHSPEQLYSWGEQAVGVDLVEPGGLYQQNDRSGKYAVLLLALTISAMFLSELLLGVRLHPLHYALVGLALAVFYLLLIALSEHVGFLLAYALAAAAVVLMVGGYLWAVLQSLRRGLAAATLLGSLYGFLLVLIRAEDTSLLLGAIGLSLLLALAMYLTRRLNLHDETGRAAVAEPG